MDFFCQTMFLKRPTTQLMRNPAPLCYASCLFHRSTSWENENPFCPEVPPKRSCSCLPARAIGDIITPRRGQRFAGGLVNIVNAVLITYYILSRYFHESYALLRCLYLSPGGGCVYIRALGRLSGGINQTVKQPKIPPDLPN
jgi:hypothetical protein